MPMTSFQVEIAPPPSPFFQKNLDLTDLWVHQPQWQASPAAGAHASSAPATPYSANNNNHYDDAEESERPKLDKWARAREIVFPAPPPAPAAPSVEVSNSGGVSSLVQKWRVFESTAGTKPPPPPPPPGTLTNDDDSVIGDWESDRTIMSGRSSIRGRDSDATESERLRVADIIRKLTPNEAVPGSVSPSRTSLDHADLMRLPPSGSRVRTSLDQADLARSCRPPTPRIRGRQAYIDLLVQVERDRHKELQGLDARKPVSHFSHRGRIQAMLKLKFLRRAMETKQDAHYSYDSQKSSRTSFERAINPKPNIPTARKDHNHNHNTPTSNSSVSLHHNDDAKTRLRDSQQDCITTSQHHADCQQHNKNIQQINADLLHRNAEQDDQRHDTLFSGQETSCNVDVHSLSNLAAETAAQTDINGHKEAEEEEAVNYHDSIDNSSNQQQHTEVETATYWEDEEGWVELQSDYQTKEANNRDWIDEVSRPRRDWEYLRQARYQEMLDPFMDKEDIRALLGRKSVSNFLSSGMRDKIDQLMISRSQGPQSNNNNNNNQRQEKRVVQVQVISKQGAEEEYMDGYEDADQSSQGQHYTTCDEYIDPASPTTSNSGPPASWPEINHNQNQINNINNQCHESSECSYQAVSPSTQQSSTNYCSQDIAGRGSSYSAHPAIEMDLIYDLRRHMEQLHQEISELRKSIKCSTDMQMKLHRSIKKEVTAALTHPDAKINGRRHPVKKSSNGSRRCCLCSKVQVDCVLYRCGHMCTCFECAHELHWSSGRCPICRAQIVDVVRIQANF